MRGLSVFLLLVALVACTFAAQSITSVELQAEQNEAAHKTKVFRNRDKGAKVALAGMILRRGADFKVDVHTTEPATQEAVSVSVKYQVPSEKGNQFVTQKWASKVSKGEEGDEIFVTISIPGTAPIGFYELHIAVKGAAQPHKSRLILLLNPWSQQDAAYFPQQDLLSEYVQNERGIIWVGSSSDYEGKIWVYDQFEGANLETALSVLYEPPIGSAAAAADVALLSRHISFVTADQICRGKWGKGPYDKGGENGEYACSKTEFFKGTKTIRNCYAPWSVHNVSILLSQYAATKVSVQYCQCFVFAAIMNTVGRSLGFATRAITNFNSAADHDDNGAVDKYYEVKDKYLRHVDEGEDSIWNFHVWNEVWLSRPAVKGFDISGWQAFDGTPQIESDGRYQVGPAPLKAVYAGRKDVKYDVQFVMAETNAPTNVWIKNATTGKFELKSTTNNNPYDPENTIGKKISAKKPGPISNGCRNPTVRTKGCDADRDDLTRTYKNLPANVNVKYFKRDTTIDAELNFPNVKEEPVFAGDSITYGYTLTNNRDEPVTFHLLYDVKATEYTDDILFEVADIAKTITVEPGTTEEVFDTITPAQYSGLFTGQLKDEDMGFLRFELTAQVDDEDDIFFLHEKHLFIHVDPEDRFF